MHVAKRFHKKCWAAFVFKGSVTSIGSIQLWRAICQLLVWNKQGNQRRNIQLCSTLFQLKGKSRGGYWALFNFTANKDEDAGLEYQQTHWDQPNTCLKPEPADWFTACLNRDIPGKEEKGYLRKRGKEICQKKRTRGIEEKRCPWKRGNLSLVFAGSLSSIGNEFTKIYRHKKARISMLK